MSYLRRLPSDFAAGLHAIVDLLLWGQVYPRRIDPALLARLTAAPFAPWTARGTQRAVTVIRDAGASAADEGGGA